ncbi:MAG TPA: 2-amino-4-hydroxy-6-hydroxymethyldihydropteridine diphosphokinase, partial [Prochlorococcus sp.]
MESPRLDDVCASLADQLEASTLYPAPHTLAVALGANLPSAFGSPTATLRAVRPELEQAINEWLIASIA